MLATPSAAPDGDWVLVASTGVYWELEPDDVLRVRAEATLVARGDLPLYARYESAPFSLTGRCQAANGWLA